MHASAKKLKNKEKKDRSGMQGDTMDQFSSDSDSDEELDDGSQQHSGSRGRHVEIDPRAKRAVKKSWLHESQHEGASEPLNLLDATAAQHVSFQDPSKRNHAAKASERLHKKFQVIDGRIVVPNERSQSESKRKRNGPAGDRDAISEAMQEGNDEISEARGSNHKRTKQDGPYQSGQGYKAKNAQGDIKRGQVDPYAYLPLDRRQLHKKKTQRRCLPQKPRAPVSVPISVPVQYIRGLKTAQCA